MKEKIKPIIMYLSYLLMVGGIVLMIFFPDTLGKMSGDTMGAGFFIMFGGMCLWFINIIGVKFYWFEDAEFLSFKTIKWLGLVTSILLLAIQLYIRIDYGFWGFFATPNLFPNWENLATNQLYLLIASLLLTGLLGFTFFSLVFCDGDKVGYQYVTVTTYYTDSGFEYDQKTSDKEIAVGGYILVGLLTSIIPFLLHLSPLMILVFFYFLLHTVKHKSRKTLIWKYVICILLVVLISGATITNTFGVDFNFPPNAQLMYQRNDDDSYTIVGVRNSSTATRLIIPEKYWGKEIKIDDGAFDECEKMSYAEIPSWACSYVPRCVKEVVVTSGTDIANKAFYNNQLETIKLPDTLTSIGNSAFSNCFNLTKIVIPQGVTSIGDCAFDGCYSLIEVCNKSSIEIVAGSKDNGCVGYYAKHIITDQANTAIAQVEDCIFYDDGTDVCLVKYVGNDAELVLPDYDSKGYAIYQRAFYENDKVVSITIPNNVTSIGDLAFSHCTNLTTVNFEEGSQCASIGYHAFYYCKNIQRIIVPTSVTSIGNYAFYGCPGGETIYYMGTEEQWDSISKGYGLTHSEIIYNYTGN